MEKKDQRQRLEREWERALEHANEQESRQDTLTIDDLNDAAGLRVKLGITSGDWTNFTDSGCPL
jgi:hypothetical protein